MAINEDHERGAVSTNTHLNQLASVGQIAAGIAHEVKNPLTAVRGFLQLLKESRDDRYVEIAQSELENAIETLENLLHVSKPDLENEPYQTINLAVELESILHLFQDQMYRVQVTTDFSSKETLIYGKKNQLKKAFFNLLKNAFEAIEDKGQISVDLFDEEDSVCVAIQDTGIGIPEEKLSMLGTPFFSTKVDGTGMGLTQVFSVIYQHRGTIEVHSEQGCGTKFLIYMPKDNVNKPRGVIELQLNYEQGLDIRQFFTENKDNFEDCLLGEAINVKDKIDEIERVGNINLLANAHKLVLFIVDGREQEMIAFAKTEGVSWAKNALTLAFKLEWVQAIRRVLWDFLYNYDRMRGVQSEREQFYAQEKRINEFMDQFLNHFFISYSHFKDELIKAQTEIVDNLSVPIIPLTTSMSILPLIGKIDTHRVATIEDKVIAQIGDARIEVLIIDLSSVVEMEANVILRFMSILDGMSMMGCKPVITGLRSEVVKTIISLGASFENKAVTKGTLQQALTEYLPGKE